LSAEGEQRAQRLAQMFGRSKGVGHLDAVYVTDARRSQQTAGPLAERLGKQVEVVSATNPKATASLVLREHDGGTVLVISQSTAVPALVRQLSGIDVSPVTDDEYDTIYVVSIPTFGHSSVLRMEY
jgi:broad specificity phosphatase PhoE